MERRIAVVEIYELLRRLGVSANYKGFRFAAEAVLLCAEQQDWLVSVTKGLYPEIAKRHGVNWRAVERNIRTVIAVAWKSNRPLLEELAQTPLERRPTSARFLAILSAGLLEGRAEPEGLKEEAAI